MNVSASDINVPKLIAGGDLFTDSGLVKINPKRTPKDAKIYSIPATGFAEEMGVKMMANIIMLSFVIAITKLVSQDALKKAVTSSVPKGTEEKNLAGMEKGYQYGLDMMADGK